MNNLPEKNFQSAVNNANHTFKLSEDRFERLIAEVEDYAIILLDKTGTISSWNKGAERIKGYSAEEIIGKNFRVFYTHEDKEDGLPDRLLNTAIQEGRANHEGWRLRNDGKRFWGSVTLTALHDDHRTVTGILKVTRDLTERKKAEDRLSNYAELLRLRNEDLKQSEERYHKMVSEVNDYAIILLDKDGRILDWNKGAEKVKGYKAEEIIGKSFKLFYTAEDKAANIPDQMLQAAFDKGWVTHEGWRIRKDGTRFWAGITMTALRDDAQQIIGYSKVTKDLTERKIAEDKLSLYTEELKQRNEALRQSEERYHKMIEEVQDYAILLLDKEGIIQNWNAGAALLKGYTASEIIGRSFKTFYTPEDITNGLPNRLLHEAETKGKANSEGWRIRKDGSKFWGSVVITALHGNNGEVIGFSKVTRDLTQRKYAEDEMKAAAVVLKDQNKVLENLNSELSAFAYIVSHDLKEPIRKIRIFSARQREEDKSITQILEYSHKIEDSAAKMQKMMEDVLAYSELSAGIAFEPVNLNDILSAVKNDIELLIEEKQAEVYTDKLPVIRGIQHQLYQLFQNLFTNALKFSRPSEKLMIKITLKQVLNREVSKEADTPHEHFYEISFTDNGIGFSQEYAKKIFEVFHKLHAKHESAGSGIGLAIVKKVMLNHSGWVIAESEPNKGSTFKLYFPISEI
jgi:PAS domain S-box-containing protein